LGLNRVNTDNQLCIIEEGVRRDFEVERSGTLANAATRVVVRAVARAEESLKVALVVERYAAEMRADAEQHEPLGLLDARRVGLRVAHILSIVAESLVNLLGRAVANKERLAAPLERDAVALGDGREVDLDVGHGQHIGRRVHAVQQIVGGRLGSDGVREAGRANDKVREGLVRHVALVVRQYLVLFVSGLCIDVLASLDKLRNASC